MIARAAQLLHAGLDLEQRVARLLLRLELGIPGPVVDLARYAECTLDRADYRRLAEARITEHKTLMESALFRLPQTFSRAMEKVQR